MTFRGLAGLLLPAALAACSGGATIGASPGSSTLPTATPSSGASSAPSAAPSLAPPNGNALQELSAASPFSGQSCATASGTPAFNSVGEPSLAVDPHNPNNVVVVWQQDRFNADGGALSNVLAVSHDGGNTFHEVLVPNLSLCTGGTDQRTSDPWLSWGPDGILYLASLTFSEAPQNQAIAGATVLVVQHSTDAGEHWSPPVAVQPNDNIYNDREAIAADPKRPGHAYYAFVLRYGSQGESGIEEFSSTSDGGNTWTSPAAIYIPQPLMLTDPTLINVLPDGSLLNTFIIANLSPFLPSSVPRINWTVMSQRSTNGGSSFSGAVNIASIYPAAPLDPQSGKVVRAYPVISTAIAPDGTAYIAWNEIPTATGPSFIRFVKSKDGGVTWSAPAVVKQSPAQAFLPSIAVASDGTIAVTYDDTRNDTGTGTTDNFTTDVWVSKSHDGGATWTETHIGGPFNMATAPESDSSGVSGLFVGDYQAIAPLGSGIAAAFAMGQPLATHGPTDLFFARF